MSGVREVNYFWVTILVIILCVGAVMVGVGGKDTVLIEKVVPGGGETSVGAPESGTSGSSNGGARIVPNGDSPGE